MLDPSFCLGTDWLWSAQHTLLDFLEIAVASGNRSAFRSLMEAWRELYRLWDTTK